MLGPGLHNIDAMVALREYPDNYFALAIADPPYGHGFADNGGCQGWFSKYHQNAESPENLGGGWNRFGGRFDKYKQSVEPIRESGESIREIQDTTRSDFGNGTRITRTGGTWETKSAKKLSRGTWRQNGSFSRNCFASHEIRLYGGVTISISRRPDVF